MKEESAYPLDSPVPELIFLYFRGRVEDMKPSSRVKEGIERIRSRMLRIDFQFCLMNLEEKIKIKKES